MKTMNKANLTYTEAMNRLETIVSKIESGQMDIDSLTDYLKEAKELVTFCKQKLTQVDQDVKKILNDESAPNVKEN